MYPNDGQAMAPTQPESLVRANYGAGVAENRPMQETAEPPRAPNLARPIQIEQLNHGYIVTVGCQKFAIENREALLHRLASYLSNPEQIEREWQSGKLKF